MLVRGLRRGDAGGGKAEIRLNLQFAQHVHTNSYHVFLTGIGAHHQLIAKAKGPDGFTVEADASLAALKGQKASDLAGTFSWRVVARRNDIAGERLPVWQMPTPAFTKPEPPAPQPSGQAVPDVALAPLPPSR